MAVLKYYSTITVAAKKSNLPDILHDSNINKISTVCKSTDKREESESIINDAFSDFKNKLPENVDPSCIDIEHIRNEKFYGKIQDSISDAYFHDNTILTSTMSMVDDEYIPTQIATASISVYLIDMEDEDVSATIH